MKLLHVAEAFSTGVFEAIRQIANASADLGYEIHVAHARRPWTATNFESMFRAGITFHRLAWDVRRRPRLLAKGAVELARLMRREQFDVIHLHSTFAGIAGALVRPGGVPTIYTPHGYMFLMSSLPKYGASAARIVEGLVGRRVSMIGAVSAAEAAEANELGIERVFVIHNGIQELDEVDVAGFGSADVDTRVGVVAAGRMSAQRQPIVVADIFQALPPHVPTSWIGDTADQEATDRFRRLGTHLTGWVSRDEVLERIRSARIYLHWTAWDGHPLSVLEAISTGAVVVAHDIPPVREILGDRSVCSNADAAVRLIGRLVSDDELYTELRLEQARAALPFSGRKMTARWCELYAALAGGASEVAAMPRQVAGES